MRDQELNGERNRCLYVLKSRGMAHSNQIREFVMTSRGVRLLPAYIGAGTMYTGSARLAQEAREKSAMLREQEEMTDKRKRLAAKRALLESQIAGIRSEIVAAQAELSRLNRQQQERSVRHAMDEADMARIRKVSPADEAR